jgi:outer membrane lipopolysaccharide assembly protein LptE/RlpB
MKKLTNFCVILILIFFLNSCGFKLVNNSELLEFNITNIETKNNKRIDFLIKQNLKRSLSNKEASNQIMLVIENKVNRSVAEKNIKNQITKYKIDINTNVQIITAQTNKIRQLDISVFGTYEFGDTQAITTNNKKTLENLLAKRISKEILNKIILDIK